MNITKNIGMLTLAAYLILIGLMSFVPALSGLGVAASVLALVSGVCILLGK